MKRRFSQLECNHTLSASTLQETAERTIERSSGEVCNLIPNVSDESTSGTTTTQSTEQSLHKIDLWGSFDRKVAEASTRRTNSVESAVEIRRYVQEKNIPRHEDALAWWKQHALSYPYLSQLFKKYLCIAATPVPSERVFSKAGELVSKKRSNRKPSNIHMLLFLSNSI